MSASVAAKGARRNRAAHLGPERRRPMVLDAAFDLFLERGYEGTSMDAIAAAAGVTKPVVYSCYPSKEELFTALLGREEERVLNQIAAALPKAADPSDVERSLTDAFTGFLRAVAASPDAYRVIFLGEGGANAAVAKRIQRGRERMTTAVAALVRPLFDGLPAAEPEPASRLLAHLTVGLAEAGARAMLSETGEWSPKRLGAVLGQLAARDPAALAEAFAEHEPSVDQRP